MRCSAISAFTRVFNALWPLRSGAPLIRDKRSTVMPANSDVLLFIDGAWCGGSGGAALPVLNPATGETIGSVARAGQADLDRALAAADRGFKAWRKVSAYDRGKILHKAGDLLRARAEAIAPVMTREHGKPQAEAKGEVVSGADILDWFAEEARRTYGRVIRGRHSRARLSEMRGTSPRMTLWGGALAAPQGGIRAR